MRFRDLSQREGAVQVERIRGPLVLIFLLARDVAVRVGLGVPAEVGPVTAISGA